MFVHVPIPLTLGWSYLPVVLVFHIAEIQLVLAKKTFHPYTFLLFFPIVVFLSPPNTINHVVKSYFKSITFTSTCYAFEI